MERTGARGFKGSLIALGALFIIFNNTPVDAGQPNAWTKPGSGSWEEPYWSLGVLPGATQDIQITNSGWKAVAISSSTAQNYPQSLNVGTITLSAPDDSFNLLLLNYAGYQTPLRANTLTVSSNTAITLLSSALEVTNTGSDDFRFEIGGVVNHGDFSAVSANLLSLGDISSGTYNMTNGTLTAAMGYIGNSYPSLFNQFGGYVTPSPMRVMRYGEYDLFAGSLGGSVETYFGGVLKQFGGFCNSSLRLDGTFELHGGLYTASILQYPSVETDFGEVVQTGGTNQITGPAQLGFVGGDIRPQVGSGYYALTNGVLHTSTLFLDAGGVVEQEGGLHIDDNGVTVSGQQIWYDAFASGAYYLDAGTVQASTLNVQNGGYFEQTGGSNEIASSVQVEGTFEPAYQLTGGYLQDASTVIDYGGFSQNGGIHITGELDVSSGYYYNYETYYGYGYLLAGGSLTVTNLEIDQGVFYHTGGTLLHRGSLVMTGGVWSEQSTGQQFGPLQLNASSQADPLLLLPETNCVVRYADSSTQPWAANLVIQNWSGSLQGNGHHQVFFGSNNSSLTGSQLTQARFDNPAGLASGIYQARLLSTGEIVPDTVTPVAPNVFTATATISNQIGLAWENQSPLATQIDIQRSLTNSGFVTVATLSGNATNFIDTNLSAAATYFYRLDARNSSAGSYSAIVSATTQPYGLLPSPWVSTDIGAVGEAGQGLYDGQFHILGSGTDIGGTQDGCQFTYYPGYGAACNREIVGRITHLDNSNPSAKAGLMIRAGTAASDPNAFVFITPGGTTGFETRTSSGGLTSSSAGPSGSICTWLKLVLSYTNAGLNSAAITGYISSDGANWTVVGSSVGVLQSTPYIGMAVTSRNNSALSQADFFIRTDLLSDSPAVPLAAAPAVQANGAMKLVLTGDFGRVYGVSVSTNLIDWSVWTNRVNEGSALIFMDADASKYPQRFYHAFVQQ